MARSHPPTLIRIVERTLREECGVKAGDVILVAVSGGSDSSALLHVLAGIADELGIGVVAHGVDHGLRAEAASELDLAETLANRLGIAFARTRLAVPRGGNLQARARAARLGALERARAACGAGYIATAHHADDRAETVLLRLLHGARPEGLGVLRPRDGAFVRPLVRARKADVERHLARHRIIHASDPSNVDPTFLRVRVRLDLLPLLQRLSPGIVAHLNALADELADEASRRITDSDGVSVPLRRAHVEAMMRAVRLGHGARIRLPGDLEIVVDPRKGELRVEEPRGRSTSSANQAKATRARERAPSQKGGAKTPKSG